MGPRQTPVSPSRTVWGQRTSSSPQQAQWVPWGALPWSLGSRSATSPTASPGEIWGKGSVVQTGELQWAAGWATTQITPLIFLLQELRDKRDLQDLPAIQIEYLILAAGEERGLSPGARGGVRAVGPGATLPPGEASPVLGGKLMAGLSPGVPGSPTSVRPGTLCPNCPQSQPPAANCAAQPLPPHGSSRGTVPR